MSRDGAITRAREYFDKGEFFKDLSRRVAYSTECQNEARSPELRAYLTDEMVPYLQAMGFDCQVLENPKAEGLPFLTAQRIEDPRLPTILTYGHGDTVRAMEGKWRAGLTPWQLIQEGDRWYGRGAADNKGQHSINFGALAAVQGERGRLGFNVKVLIEMGEEMGSPGLHAICEKEKERLKADVLIASDGPRLTPHQPTVFGGSRGILNFDLCVELRDGGHHSGNWGGLLANPGILLAHAIASLVDQRGKILVPGLKPEGIPDSVRHSLAEIQVTGEGGPQIDPDWGESGLSLSEKVYGWSTLEILAFVCGDPNAPAHAIPPKAWARCHMRFVAGQDPSHFLPSVHQHLNKHGFKEVMVIPVRESWTNATRLNPDHPMVQMALSSIERTTGKKTAFLPNLGGTLPNDAFTDILGMPTVWIPHSYGGCSQHAPDEHLLAPVAREGLELMAGLFWDLGEKGLPI
ncbi:MAG: M20 family metallopeptidase [Deltaproteobacteria bacterium]|nr:M20 family metallopeptidase [Deltaproteobacteria bacterium]